ncbi:hypothetical protein [Mycoplasma sp. ATU-Cv-508]|uniref:hypothetical protein n=1 Tax=Mycoplasma sp. ATU-Cv-508 TaxID=2048001 RepID=UPI000FDD22B4
MKKLSWGVILTLGGFWLPTQVVSCAPHVDLSLTAKVRTQVDGIHPLSQTSLEEDLKTAIEKSSALSDPVKKSALEKLTNWLNQNHHFHVGQTVVLFEVQGDQGQVTLEIVTQRA